MRVKPFSGRLEAFLRSVSGLGCQVDQDRVLEKAVQIHPHVISDEFSLDRVVESASRSVMEEHQEIIRAISEHTSLMTTLLEDEGYLTSVTATAGAIAGALKDGNKVLFFGNGGSAADAQHLAAELAGRFLTERRSLPGIALSCNTSSLTAIGNDYGFDLVFARQLAGLGIAGDVAFGISTSGNSPNVLRAMEVAGEKRLIRVGLTGRGGKLADLVEHCIRIPADATPRIQEAHILTGHILTEIVERKLFAKDC